MWRQPAIRGVFALMSCSAMVAAVAGCTPRTMVPSSCPDHFAAGIVWTSPTARASLIQLVDAGRIVAEIPIPVQGVSWTDQAPVRHGDKIGFSANGNAQKDLSHLVTMSLKTCEVSLNRVDEPILNLSTTADGFVTVGNLNGISYMHKFSDAPSLEKSVEFQSQIITAIHGVDDYLYAQTDSLISNETALLTLHADDLSEVSRAPLPIATGETSRSMTTVGEKVIIPRSFHGERDDDRLLLVDRNDFSTRTIALDRPSPFYVRALGNSVYVAHTAMNSSSQPLGAYRYVSVVNMADETATLHQLSDNILRMDVTPSVFIALGENPDGSAVVHRYSLPDFAELDRVDLKPPESIPDAFAATVFLPQS